MSPESVAAAPVEPVRPAGRRNELPLTTRERFRDGDPAALGEVYDRYARAVWSVAMTVTRADQLAQDATQETFIRAWNAAPTYDPGRDLGPWLLAIARYSALDLVRRELRPTRGGHEAEQETVVEAPGIDRVWLSWAVQEALRQVADHERQIVWLTFYEDLTQAQIAERLDLPLGTVKSRSHRAFRRLAALLVHVLDEPGTGNPTPGNPAVPGARKQTSGRTTIEGPAIEGRHSR